jgi:hypothetical protein
MKIIRTNLIVLSVLLFASCIITSNSDHSKYTRQDVVGSWEITKSSLKKLKKEKEEFDIVTSFKLKSDSTYTVVWGVSKPIERSGSWDWKPEKRVGTEKIGFNVRSDVLFVSGHQILGFLIHENDGEMYLNANQYVFKKVN